MANFWQQMHHLLRTWEFQCEISIQSELKEEKTKSWKTIGKYKRYNISKPMQVKARYHYEILLLKAAIARQFHNLQWKDELDSEFTTVKEILEIRALHLRLTITVVIMTQWIWKNGSGELQALRSVWILETPKSTRSSISYNCSQTFLKWEVIFLEWSYGPHLVL